MASEDNAQIQDVASGSIQGDGTTLKARGCTVSRLAQGQYQITIDPLNIGGQDLPASESCSFVQVKGATPDLSAVLGHGSAIQKIVEIRDATDTAQDADFSFTLSRLLQ